MYKDFYFDGQKARSLLHNYVAFDSITETVL